MAMWHTPPPPPSAAGTSPRSCPRTPEASWPTPSSGPQLVDGYAGIQRSRYQARLASAGTRLASPARACRDL
ncbi:hypothetical protein BC937DRAFT_90645 [Endogone sp. FLAS-F59071]|nr:hypothetical protein BC937DRAFT_90645 [Endogone sp. FLAS-F59071]|eukprot:RUS22014.1 hypothetical protein BC937DRAFT_90645 [Endogone sp. FLAS-F59071]